MTTTNCCVRRCASSPRRRSPTAAEWDRTCHFPVDVERHKETSGLFGIVFPEQWGEGGGDFASRYPFPIFPEPPMTAMSFFT